MGQPETAAALAREALAILAQAFGSGHPYTAYCHLALGVALRDGGHPGDAEPELRRSLATLTKALPAGHPQISLNRVELALCLMALDRLDEAEAQLREALPGLQASPAPDAAQVNRIQGLLGEIAGRRGTARRASSGAAR